MDWIIVLEFVIKLLIVALFVFGAWLIVSAIFSVQIQRSMQSSRFKRDASRVAQLNAETSAFSKHINMILSVVFDRKISNGTNAFMLVSATSFLFTYLFLFFTSTVLFALTAAVIMGSIPYILLRLRLRSMQISSSYEGEALVSELSNHYKMCSLNMLEAIDKTAAAIQNQKYSKRALFKLSIALKNMRKGSQLDEIIKTFVFAFETEWAIQLGMNIQLAVSDGTDVRSSLDDIQSEIKLVRETLEKGKREHSEAYNVIRLLIFPCYLLTIYGAHTLFGFTLEKFFDYQFINPMGQRMAIFMFPMMLFCFVFMGMSKRSKFDV